MRESPDSFSDGMFVLDKEWNVAYIYIHIHILCQTRWRKNSDCIHMLWDEHLMLSMSVSVCNNFGCKVSKSNYVRKANPTYLNH